MPSGLSISAIPQSPSLFALRPREGRSQPSPEIRPAYEDDVESRPTAPKPPDKNQIKSRLDKGRLTYPGGVIAVQPVPGLKLNPAVVGPVQPMDRSAPAPIKCKLSSIHRSRKYFLRCTNLIWPMVRETKIYHWDNA
jgi:hypothetical protein